MKDEKITTGEEARRVPVLAILRCLPSAIRHLPFSILLLLLLAACSREVSPPVVLTAPPEIALPAQFKLIAPEEAAALIESRPDLLPLDFRTEQEWVDEGRLPRAQMVNYFRANLPEYLAGLDRKRPYLLYCAIGGRAELAAEQMAPLGFAEVYLLKGGFNGWKAAGGRVER